MSRLPLQTAAGFSWKSPSFQVGSATPSKGCPTASSIRRYRPDGWTVRQVVHHLADSHLHSYMRTRFALAENEPTVPAYDENTWADLKDARLGPTEPSLLMLEGLHSRWSQLLESMKEADWDKKFIHSVRGPLTMRAHIPTYAWHGRHHTAHITELRKRKGWT